jgi:hypothetical protein
VAGRGQQRAVLRFGDHEHVHVRLAGSVVPGETPGHAALEDDDAPLWHYRSAAGLQDLHTMRVVPAVQYVQEHIGVAAFRDRRLPRSRPWVATPRRHRHI